MTEIAIRMNALVYLFNHTTYRKKSTTITTTTITATTTTTNILARIATYCMEQAYDKEENRSESNRISIHSNLNPRKKILPQFSPALLQIELMTNER